MSTPTTPKLPAAPADLPADFRYLILYTVTVLIESIFGGESGREVCLALPFTGDKAACIETLRRAIAQLATHTWDDCINHTITSIAESPQLVLLHEPKGRVITLN